MTAKVRIPVDMTRAGLARETGCNIETIRYYEKISLLPLPVRTENNYRIYNWSDVKRLAFIMRLRELGFTIEGTRDLLTLVDGHEYTCREVHEITLAHIDNVKAKIRDLRKIQKTLTGMVEECSRGAVPDCPVIDVLYGKSFA